MRPPNLDLDGWLRLALWTAWFGMACAVWRLLIYAGALPRWP